MASFVLFSKHKPFCRLPPEFALPARRVAVFWKSGLNLRAKQGSPA
jgi:hypothetical protein